MATDIETLANTKIATPAGEGTAVKIYKRFKDGTATIAQLLGGAAWTYYNGLP